MSKLAYDYTNEELVDALGKSAARCGFSNSGLVIDPMAGYDRQEYHYLKGVLLSRLDGEQPPARRGDIVVLGPEGSGRPTLYSIRGNGSVSKGKKLEITRTWYLGNGRWAYSFDSATEYQFAAENFEKAELEVQNV